MVQKHHVPSFLKGKLMSEKFVYKDEFLYLTTTGRKSGLPREIEIWFVEYDGCYYLCSEGRERADWVQNVQHNPSVSFYVNNKSYQGTGRALSPDADAERITALSAMFEQKYNWSDGLLVQLCPSAK
jgi:deazaflavin-dependent oxidoreductase (nitroreductase family)